MLSTVPQPPCSGSNSQGAQNSLKGRCTGSGAIQVVHMKNIAMLRMRRASSASSRGKAGGCGEAFSMLRMLSVDDGWSKKYSRVKSETESGSIRNSFGP